MVYNYGPKNHFISFLIDNINDNNEFDYYYNEGRIIKKSYTILYYISISRLNSFTLNKNIIFKILKLSMNNYF